MFKTLRSRIILIAIFVAMSGWQLYQNGLKLGLDLQGGMHLVLEVDDPDGTMTAEAKADMIDRVDRIIRTRIDELGVEEPLIQQVGGERLIVELAGVSDENQAKDIVQRNAFLEFKLVLPLTDMEAALTRIDRSIVADLGVDSIRALGRDVAGTAANQQGQLEDLLFGGDTASATAEGDSAAVEPAAPEEDPEEAFRPFSSLLSFGDVEGSFFIAIEDVPVATAFLNMPGVQRSFPRNQVMQWGSDLVGRPHLQAPVCA